MEQAQGLIFSIARNEVKFCIFNYKITESNLSSNAYLLINISNDEHSYLPKVINETTYTNEIRVVDLKSYFGKDILDNFELSNELSIIGNSIDTEMSMLNVAESTIILAPSGEAGPSRIFYTLASRLDPDNIKIGLIVLTVSEPNNLGFSVENTAESYPKLGEQIEFDVSNLIFEASNNSCALMESCENYKLTSVRAFDAYTSLMAQPGKERSFLFSSENIGTYDVSYIVSDGQGGLASGIVRFITDSSTILSWKNIEVGSSIYIAPWTKDKFVQLGGYIAQSYYDEPPYQDIPLFNYFNAETLCLNQGGTLPQKDDLINLFSGSAFGSAYPFDWPEKVNYWLKNESGKYFTLGPGSVETENGSKDTVAVVTCISDGQLVDFSLMSTDLFLKEGFSSVITEASSKVESELNEEGLPNKTVLFYSLPSSDSKTQYVNTDMDGFARTTFSFYDIGEYDVFSQYRSSQMSKAVSVNEAKIEELTLSTEKGPFDVGETLTISSVIDYDNGEQLTEHSNLLEWDATDELEFEEFDEEGNAAFSAKKEGTAYVSAKFGDHLRSNDVEIEIIDPIVSFSLGKDIEISKGLIFEVSPEISFSSGSTSFNIEDIEWSFESNLIKLDCEWCLATNTSIFQAIEEGDVTLSATYRDEKSEKKVTITPEKTYKVDWKKNIEFGSESEANVLCGEGKVNGKYCSETRPNLYIGSSREGNALEGNQLELKDSPTTTVESIIWTSTNPEVISINAQGQVIAHYNSLAEIQAKSEDGIIYGSMTLHGKYVPRNLRRELRLLCTNFDSCGMRDSEIVLTASKPKTEITHFGVGLMNSYLGDAVTYYEARTAIENNYESEITVGSGPECKTNSSEKFYNGSMANSDFCANAEAIGSTDGFTLRLKEGASPSPQTHVKVPFNMQVKLPGVGGSEVNVINKTFEAKGK